MGFSFFGKKQQESNGPVFTDITYISTVAKIKACCELAKKEPNTIFICWFAESAREWNAYLLKNGIGENRLIDARHLHAAQLQNKTVVFAEHHPLHNKELDLVKNWEQQSFKVYNALDEPLFAHFGGERIISMMQQLGMKEDEPIEHPLVSKSIINAQEKIAKGITVEQSANSATDWMKLNVK